MDKPISSQKINKDRLRSLVKWILGIATLILAFFLFRKVLTQEIDRSALRIAKVEKGAMNSTITATGLIVPSFEQTINSPIATEIQKVHLQSGDRVAEGDLILDLDPSFIQIAYDQTQDELEVKKNNVDRLKLEYDKSLQELDLDDQIKALQVASLEAQVKDRERLKEIGGATEEEWQQAKMNLEIAKLEKKKLANELAFRKQSITKDKRNLELEVMIQQKRLKELSARLGNTAVKSPTHGVITWIHENIGEKVNEGDPLVRVANLNSFKVEGSFSDRYMQNVRPGTPVEVRINRQSLKGIVVNILPEVKNNTVDCIIQLEQPSHPDLRPNLRVEVQIITDAKEETLKLMAGSAFSGARKQDAFVVQGDQAFKRSIEIGITNRDFIEIVSGLEAGESVIISNVEAFKHKDQINIR